MRSHSILSRTSIAISLLLLLLAWAPVSAQTYTSHITGVATDQTGAVLPGVQLVLLNTATKETREAVTDEQGRFRFT
jgi:hypothetical protein